ncbi:hypothetical protein SAMN02745127_00819 [Oceanospirillum multiglobuliferum]|uniref:Uncharacterized protein n=1 Tax=Oceanospirillum multiglobuliferum TaxID=64969 RepID=A0A1T4MKU7_9GAMM|nr:DUF6586 family protein [Oceanospirillum multiglobuliferum]OPX56986.1 hypothetical protein BTE48_00685 [Oceanospirillum multiglobuliferum]SJZ67491.1 hypothetical protein SAMN02745127_00819 [Oceanospirillum multiglobuliferum]
MASFASRTMQKLFAARILLKHLDQLSDQDELIQPAFKTAHIEAVVFQMQGALQALLYEIAEAARMPAGQWHSINELHQAALENERTLPQLNILIELQKDSFSWLSQFSRRYQACWLPDKQGAKEVHQQTPESSGAMMIAVADDSVSDQVQLNAWLDSMQALVKDLRLTMQEY